MLFLIVLLAYLTVGVAARRVVIEAGNVKDGDYAVVFWPFFIIGLLFLGIDWVITKVARWLKS